jgi:benzoyl-CoA reductase subunit B
LSAKALEKMREDLERNRSLVGMLELGPPEMRVYGQALKAVEEGRKLGWWMFCTSPELLRAMDIQPLCFEPYYSPVSQGRTEELADAAVNMGFPSEICTLMKMAVGLIASEMAPKPDVIITASHPCDSMTIGYPSYMSLPMLKDVPMFAVDSPYWRDERAEQYVADELKRMIAFIEEETGNRLDVDRLKDLVEESNRANEYWLEANELRRAVPCPHNGQLLNAAVGAHWFAQGLPEATEFFKALAEDARVRVAEKRGALPDEKLRVFWCDLFISFAPVSDWMEQEWGANCVMNILSYGSNEPVDTTSLDTMLRGIGKDWCNTPMARQFRGPVEYFTEDVVRICTDYKVDCVIFPGYIGHKSCGASIGILREVCRDIGMPLLTFECDLFDARMTPAETVQAKIGEFFRTVVL